MAGKTCIACHLTRPLEDFHRDSRRPDGRHTYCRDCKSARDRESYQRCGDQQRARGRAKYHTNRERYLARCKEWRAANPDTVRRGRKRGHLRRAFDMTPADYAALFEQQGGCCRICLQPETRRNSRTGELDPLSIDHDHQTGRVRGLLCNRCNRALGLFNDDPDLLARALEHLSDTAEVG